MTSIVIGSTSLDLDLLFRLRLVIGRLGEMDNASWWNTRGLLSANGAFVLSRGLPRTHYFAQARTVFAVAAQRCQNVFSSSGVATLWNIHADVEDAFEDFWQLRMSHSDEWLPLLKKISALRGYDVLTSLRELELADMRVLKAAQELRHADAGNAIPLPTMPLDNYAMVLLAAGFAQAEPGRLAVPFLQVA